MQRNAKYPPHLAKLVCARLREQGTCPPEPLVTRLMEILYFASFKTEEGRPILCTINYLDPAQPDREPGSRIPADRWNCVRFDRPIPLDIRSLSKLAKATDPAVSSLAVYSDRSHKLFVWGLIDQELRYSDYIALDGATPQRPGLFQATITGVGNISVYIDYSLVGSLEQNTLVEDYHDVLWVGPVHRLLIDHLPNLLDQNAEGFPVREDSYDRQDIERELLVRWLNSLCRILMNMQHYRHGGGLLVLPQASFDGLNVRYRLKYPRLPKALLGLVQSRYLRGRLAAEIKHRCESSPGASLPNQMYWDVREFRRRFDEHRNEVLGCARFIASLSCVDGFVLLDRQMVVHGFGAEVRTDHPLNDIYVAGDSEATPRLLRRAELDQFGTRHRAIARYCYQKPGTLGFVVSQDGDIRVMMRIGERLILWENIEVQLAFKVENVFLPSYDQMPAIRPFDADVA